MNPSKYNEITESYVTEAIHIVMEYASDEAYSLSDLGDLCATPDLEDALFNHLKSYHRRVNSESNKENKIRVLTNIE